MHYGFKVVEVLADGTLRSAVSRSMLRVQAYTVECIVSYLLGQWVYPNPGNGPMCVFEKEEDAHYFVKVESTYKGGSITLSIFECEYELSKSNRVWTSISEDELGWLPFLTRLAESIKLTKKIK